MKILLIFSKIGSPTNWMVGLSFMSAVLKEAGYDVDLLEIEKKEDINEVISFVKSYRPQIIGLSANSHQYSYILQIAKEIKSKFNLPLFLGGVHSTMQPNEVIQEEVFDGISIGEAEYAFLELVKRIEKGENYTNINNFWFRKNGEIIKNNIGSLLEDLDKLPFPDVSIFKHFKEAGGKKVFPRFIFSRGCPFDCTYCSNHAFKKIYAGHGKYVRFRSVDKAIEEIGRIKNKYNFEHFRIDDDTFSLNRNWVLEFCEKYSKKFNMSFECNIRVGTADEQVLKSLKMAGCRMIKIGLEAGNEKLRMEVLNRHISDKEIINLFDLAKKIGLLTFSFNMIGIPGETKQSIKETINLNVRIKPDFMQITVFYPYPNTLLGERCVNEGLITRKKIDSCMDESILQLPNLSRRYIKRAVRNFKYNVYKHYDWKKALEEKKNNFKKIIISNPFLSRLIRPIYRAFKKR